MNRRNDGRASGEEFLQFWIDRGGFEYVDGLLVPMPDHFGDHCFPVGSTYEDSDWVVVKLGDAPQSEIDSAARRHLSEGHAVVLFLTDTATICAVYRSDDFARRYRLPI